MAEKDITEKMLEDYHDVFADIINVLLFRGERKVLEEELVDSQSISDYEYEGKIREMERDLKKFWTKNNICLSIFGLENQSREEPFMPVRVIGYEGTAYRGQMAVNNADVRSGKKKQEEIIICPVITLVLYFGKSGWSKPKSLKECFTIPEGLEQYVNDYHINVFELNKLTKEQVDMFQSDFKIVADYYYQINNTNNYVPSKEEMVHVSEVLNLMRIMTGDDRFQIAQERVKEGGVTMCEVLDRVEARGKAKGEAIGEARGKTIGIIIGKVLAYSDEGFTNEEIQKKTGLSIEKIEEILSEQE